MQVVKEIELAVSFKLQRDDTFCKYNRNSFVGNAAVLEAKLHRKSISDSTTIYTWKKNRVPEKCISKPIHMYYI